MTLLPLPPGQFAKNDLGFIEPGGLAHDRLNREQRKCATHVQCGASRSTGGLPHIPPRSLALSHERYEDVVSFLNSWSYAMNRFGQLVGPGLVALLALTGCSGSEEEGSVKVVAETKGLSCDTSSGIKVSALRQILVDNGIAVTQTTCGFVDGIFLAVCGPPDGGLAFFVVPESKVPLAKGLGFFVAADAPLAKDYGACQEWR